MTRAAIALGSNLGDRLAYLASGAAALRAVSDVVAVSPLYETAPVGGPDQGAYLNAVMVVETDLAAKQLLATLHEIEHRADRARDVRWGPRTLDLDLVLFGDAIITEPEISVPHPRFHERRFVLEPLLAAWPDARDPRGRDLAADLRAVAEQDLEEVGTSDWTTAGDPRDVHGDPAGSDRGERWVFAQFGVLAIAIAVVLTTRESLTGGPAVTAAGLVSTLVGAVLGLAGVRSLGRNLTPYPEPVRRGELVQSGAYGLVRHPIYGAVVLITVGLALVVRSWPGLVAALVVTGFFYAKAGFEERRLERVYPEYQAYRAATPHRIIPWIL